MAAITSYSTLLTEVASWLARSNLTTAVPGFVQNWEQSFYREKKNWGQWNEAALSGTIADGVLAVPADYLALKYAYINGAPSSRLDRVSLNQLYGTYPRGGETGLPRWIARDVSNFAFGPTPDSTYDVRGVYYAKPVKLSAFAGDAAASWLILNAPDLLLYGSLLQATPYLQNDKRIPTWEMFYGQALRSHQNLMIDEDVSGSPVQEVLG